VSEISLAALPNDEKRRLANDLIGSHTVRALAAMFGVGAGTISRWTNPETEEKTRLASLAYKRRNRTEINTAARADWWSIGKREWWATNKRAAQTCTCPDPIRDQSFDRYCLRTSTCVYCGKKAKR
jgi:hypothetical protein